MCDVIRRHEILSQATTVLNIPGHDSTRVSFGSRVAATIARDQGISIVKAKSKSAFRPQAKNLTGAERSGFLNGEFSISSRLDEQQVLIADDIFRSGTSMGVVASVAREAGAWKIYGLCGVRTMRR
jgi:predicted amidophosphoribosyltransferase